jgi:hypothetical protein
VRDALVCSPSQLLIARAGHGAVCRQLASILDTGLARLLLSERCESLRCAALWQWLMGC